MCTSVTWLIYVDKHFTSLLVVSKQIEQLATKIHTKTVCLCCLHRPAFTCIFNLSVNAAALCVTQKVSNKKTRPRALQPWFPVLTVGTTTPTSSPHPATTLAPPLCAVMHSSLDKMVASLTRGGFPLNIFLLFFFFSRQKPATTTCLHQHEKYYCGRRGHVTGRKSSDGGMGAGVVEMKCYLRNVPLAWRRVVEVLRRELGRITCEGGRVTEGVPHTSRHSNDSDNCS